MEVDEESLVSVAKAEPAVTITDVQMEGQMEGPVAGAVPLQPSIPVVPPMVTPPLVPPIAPIPVIPTLPLVRPLAPLPARPPVVKSVTQNGELRASDSDSETDEGRQTTAEYEISEESRLVRERQQKAMQEFLMKRRAAALAVPTNDMSVRARLRRLGEPITLFGEREMERRDRLRMIMVKLDAEGQLEKLMKAHEEEEAAPSAKAEEADEQVEYPFYTEGSKELLDARIDIAKFSISRTASRLQRMKRRREDPDEDVDAEIDWVLKQAGRMVLDCSELGDDRPLSGCSFSHDGKLLATWYVYMLHLLRFY